MTNQQKLDKATAERARLTMLYGDVPFINYVIERILR